MSLKTDWLETLTAIIYPGDCATSKEIINIANKNFIYVSPFKNKVTKGFAIYNKRNKKDLGQII